MVNTQLLRATVFGQSKPAESTLLRQLLAAEADEPSPSNSQKTAQEGILWSPASLQTGQGHRGTAMGSQTTGLAATTRLRMAFVPTSIVHLLDASKHPLISLQIRNGRHSIARVRLSAFVEDYSARSIQTVEVPAGEAADVPFLPTFFPERLRGITEVSRATLRLHIDDLDGRVEQERTFPIWLLARSSALLHVQDPSTGFPQDLTPYLAAWVTPGIPAVFELLRKAADALPSSTIASYQVDADGVAAQVKAIYAALQSTGIAYINSHIFFGAMPGVLGQRIRLPRESLLQRSANCIDGTVLFASVLEAASLHPAIVLVPGHAFLAWETAEGSAQWEYLETTLVGSHDFETAVDQGRKLAKAYETLAQARPSAFCRLPLRILRDQGIWPME